MLKNIRKNKQIYLFLILSFLVSIIPVLFLFREGFFLSDDGEWMVIRFSAFYQTLLDGQIPPRFFGRLNHGFGYPIGTFLYPAFFYFATPFKIIGLNFQEAIKAVIILSFFFSGIGSYLWLRGRFPQMNAFIGSCIYVLFPYHLYDLTVRGSIGELLAFGILPFLLLSIDKKNMIFGSFLFGLLILSHNSFAMLMTPFLLFYTYLSGSRSLLFLYPLGLLLSAYFWLPSILELPITVFSDVTISDWREYFLSGDNLSLVGYTGLFLFLISLYLLYQKKHTVTLFFVGSFFIGMFFASSLSILFWHLPLLPKLVQFPWRFLILCVWSGGFIIAHYLTTLSGKKHTIAVLVVLMLIIISALPYLSAFRPVSRDDGYYYTNEDTTTTHGEYMPRSVKKIPLSRPAEKVVLTAGHGEITEVRGNSYETTFRFVSTESATVTVNTIDYPGWKFEVNGMVSDATHNDDGYLTLHLKPGDYLIQTIFSETPLRLAANSISLMTALLLLVYWIIPSNAILKKPPEWYNTLKR